MSPRANEPLGRRRYWPIFEACERHNLPIGLHVPGFGSGNASTPAGWPSFYLEEHQTFAYIIMGVFTSMVLEGVFERFQGLKLVLIEGGFAWVPPLCWRLDKHWERMRSEVPHLKRPPSEYIREHIWYTTQPMEEPERPEDLVRIIDWIGWDRLLFSTDYPHWDFDDPKTVFRVKLTEAQKRMIFSENAKRGLRARLRWRSATSSPGSARSRPARASSSRSRGARSASSTSTARFTRSSANARTRARRCARARSCSRVESDEPGRYRVVAGQRDDPLPWHGWQYDIRTGQSWCDPDNIALRQYAVSVEAGERILEGPYVAETYPVSVEESYVVVEI